jgi:hypothetical protein
VSKIAPTFTPKKNLFHNQKSKYSTIELKKRLSHFRCDTHFSRYLVETRQITTGESVPQQLDLAENDNCYVALIHFQTSSQAIAEVWRLHGVCR